MIRGPFLVFAVGVAVGTLGLIMPAIIARSADTPNTIGVHFTNGSSDDINVTVYDVYSGQTQTPLLNNQRINARGQVDKDVVSNSSGNGSVSWTSKTDAGKCTSGNKSGFGVGSDVDVSEGSSCP
jgi:hypothetical protein